jgi:hypothetical protein
MTSEFDLHLCCQCDQKFLMKEEWELCHKCILKRDAFHYQRGLKDANIWISVKDRLPDLTCRVLVNHFSLGVISAYRHYEDSFTCDSSWDCPIEQITHWMPLPEPPKC